MPPRPTDTVFLRALLTAALLVLPGCSRSFAESLPHGANRTPAAQNEPAVDRPYAAQPYDAEAYADLVATLAAPEMEGRGPGTAGIDRARDLIIDKFKSAGLRPAFRTKPNDGDDARSYTQEFEIALGARADAQSLSARAADNDWHDFGQPGTGYNALGLSGSGAFEGGAVFVGYAISNDKHKYDSLVDADPASLRGKVLVAFRFEPQDDDSRSKWAHKDPKTLGPWTEAATFPAKAKWAEKHGAKALLLINPPSQDSGSSLRLTRQSAGEAAGIPVMHISLAQFRQTLSAAGLDGDTLPEQWQRAADKGTLAPAPLAIEFKGQAEVRQPVAKVHNVAAVLPGKGDLADQVVVLGAHYDHLGFGDFGSAVGAGSNTIHPGADDNASGTAGLVMVAQRLAELAPQHPGPRRTVLFAAFTGEERGLLGSMHMLRHIDELGLSAERIAAMVNLDMIGRPQGEKVHVFGVDTGRGLRERVKAAAQGLGLTVAADGSPMGGSDHSSFHVHQIPAVHVFAALHGDYHRPGDTADKIDAGGAARIVRYVDNLVVALATEQERLAFVPPRDEKGHGHGSGSGGGFGSGVILGVMPDYATMEGDDGCAISGVIPGSPAERAGLRAGDVITQWNEAPMRNVRTLTEALAGGKPGDKVKLTVKRGGKDVVLDVELGKR